jgi:hypothetical protein
MRAVIVCAVLLGCSSAFADVTLTASGFNGPNPSNLRGNGTFTLKQQKNAAGDTIDCWDQMDQSGVGWRASYNKHSDTMRVVFHVNGNIISEYGGAGLSGTYGLRYRAPDMRVPPSIKIQ